MNKRHCIVCGMGISVGRPYARCCSEPCRVERARALARERYHTHKAPRRPRVLACIICGVKFETRTNGLACGPACRRQRHRVTERIRITGRTQSAPRHCAVCGISIQHHHNRAKTCSLQCRIEWKRLRDHGRGRTNYWCYQKRRLYFKEYGAAWRKRNPDKMRAYMLRQREQRKLNGQRREQRANDWKRIGVTIKALRQMGLLDGVPAKTTPQRRAIYKMARELGFT